MNEDEIVILENSRKYMRYHFIWPQKNDTKGRFYRRIFIVTLFTSTFWFGMIGHLVLLRSENRTKGAETDIMMIISFIGLWFYIGIHVSNVMDLSKIYALMSDFSKFGIPSNFEEENKKLNFYSKVHYIYLNVLVTVAVVSPYFDYNSCKKLNQKQNITTENCGMMAVWVPFDIDYFPMREISVLIQVYSCRYVYITFALVVFSMWESVEHLALHMRYLRNLFMNAVHEEDGQERRRIVSTALRYHNTILRYAKLLNHHCENSNFTFVVLHGTVMGIASYQIVNVPKIFDIFYLIGFMITLIVISYAGEKLVSECYATGETIYSMPWYDLEIDIQKDLILALLRSQKPAILRAGAFGIFNYTLVIAVCKTTYTILTLLKTVS